MTQITKTTDLLNCRPMFLQVKNHSQKAVLSKVSMFVIKCINGIGITLDPAHVEQLAEDIIDKYSHESLEDIAECLKRGRQGYYGTSYNKLNMMIISEWMVKHLESKAIAREKMIKDKFQTEKEPLAMVDYELYKKRISTKSEGKLSKPKSEQISKYTESVLGALNVSVDDLYSGSREKNVADARHAISNYMRNYLKMTNSEIKNYWNQK